MTLTQCATNRRIKHLQFVPIQWDLHWFWYETNPFFDVLFCWCQNLVLFLQVQLLSFLALLTQAVASAPKVVRCRATLMIRLVALQGVWLDRTEITQPFTGNSHEIEHTFTLCHLMLIFWHLHLLRFAIFQSFKTTHYVNFSIWIFAPKNQDSIWAYLSNIFQNIFLAEKNLKYLNFRA